MKIVDSGVVAPSFMDFTLSTSFAKGALYYVPQFGHFYCTNAYHIAREHMDLFLLVYVCAGRLQLRTGGRDYIAETGQTALLDCRAPHEYFCTGDAEFLWFHFNGNSSAQYAAYLADRAGVVFPAEEFHDLREGFDRVLAQVQAVPVNEHLTSLAVNRLLTQLATPERQHGDSHPVAPALSYIRQHFAETIPLADLASQCSMSTSHFIRSFQHYVGRTPHEYLLLYRLQQGKRLLLSSTDSIETIAALCGFNSASHFTRAFHKVDGVTPSAFRQLQF